MTVGIVQFPGTNCELDVANALSPLGIESTLLWYGNAWLPDSAAEPLTAVIIPGGFAHGDYLRPGAIARFSPIMAAITEFATGGGSVVGICNGFQVLTEVGLLPGALCLNAHQKFVCSPQKLRVHSTDHILGKKLTAGDLLQLPINHFGGSYTNSRQEVDRMWDSGQVFLTYEGNPNGSVDDIAGITNPAGNVVGLMPHPERASSELIGSDDGNLLFLSLLQAASGQR